MKAIQAVRAGGPEVLELHTVPDPQPGEGEVLVRVAAAGVNFIDTYRRSGLGPYAVDYPDIPGTEGSGEVVAVGTGDVARIAVGDRVAWPDAPASYAERVVVPASAVLPVPDDVDDVTAAAIPLQGLTAHYLTRSSYPARRGDTVLVHAGAGGTGALVVAFAAAAGARVIATTSTAAKEAVARAAGAAEVIRYTELPDLTTDLPAAVRDLTGGEGVAAVYDGVGKDTFDASLACLRVRGTLVLFGGSSGPVPPVDPQRLNAAGSVFLTRPTLAHHIAGPAERGWRAGELFAAVKAGGLTIRVEHRYPLAEARRAHEDLEARRTTGKLVLMPSR